MRERLAFLLLLTCGPIGACAGDIGAPPLNVTEGAYDDEFEPLVDESEPLIDKVAGFRNYANPEIGLVSPVPGINDLLAVGGLCTGTAVAPNVILTARHCVGGANYFFTIQEPLNVRRFTVRQRWSSPNADIALLWVREPVPWTRALEEHGPVGATAAVVGFGGDSCHYGNGWEYNYGVGVKRVGFFTTQANGNIDPGILCPGDSGGPIIDWSNGKIFGVVSSGWGTAPGDTASFAATNLPGVWNDLMFVIWIWQAESNAGR